MRISWTEIENNEKEERKWKLKFLLKILQWMNDLPKELVWVHGRAWTIADGKNYS